MSLSLSPHSSNSHYEHLTISTLDANPHVVVVALNRPRKRNAINSKMWKEIGHAFRNIGSTGDGTRCVLLVGAGEGFCAGIDITDENFGFASMDTVMDSQDDDDDGESGVDVARKYMAFRPKILEMQSCLTAVEECHVPVVCAIHGVCIGAGIDLSSCADVRICSTNAKFSVREARIGLAADVGTLQRLPIICGGHGSRIRELCLTGEDFDAAEASRLGFVSRIISSNGNRDGDGEDYLKVGVKICQLIARNSPVAVHATKLSLNYSRDHTVKEGLEHIASHNAAALMTRDIGASFLAATTGKRKGGHEPAAADFHPLLPVAKL